MSLELVELLKEVRATRDTLGTADQQRNFRIDQLEAAINDIAPAASAAPAMTAAETSMNTRARQIICGFVIC